jgi:hypothetical protein
LKVNIYLKGVFCFWGGTKGLTWSIMLVKQVL